MADDTFDGNTDAAPLDGNEIIPCIDDPSGTPVDGRFTPADLATYLGTGTAMTGMHLQWDATDGITVLTGQCYTESGDNVSASSVIAKASLSLSVSTLYNVYVYLSGGSPAAEVVTTAPVAWTGTAYSKTGDTSRRYVGTIFTDGSGNIIPFLHVDNRMYYNTATTAAPIRVLAAGADTSATAVDVSGIVSSIAQVVFVRASNDHASVVARLSNSSGDIIVSVKAVTQAVCDVFIEAGNIYYFNSAGSGSTYIEVLGYVVDR